MLNEKIKKGVHYYLDIAGLYNSKDRNDSENAKSILNYFGNHLDTSPYRFETCLEEKRGEYYKFMIFDTKPLPFRKESNHGVLTISKGEYLTFILHLSHFKTNIKNNILDVE